MAVTKVKKKPLSASGRDLLNVAIELIATNGYETTSVQDIVDAGGVTKGAFYHHFVSKDDVLRQILAEYLGAALDDLRAIGENGEPPIGQLRAVISLVMDSMVTNHHSMLIFLRERRSLSTKSMRSLRRMRDEWERIFVDIIDAGIKSGEFKDVGSPRILAFGIIGMWTWALEWFHETGPLKATDIAEIYADLVLDGLANP